MTSPAVRLDLTSSVTVRCRSNSAVCALASVSKGVQRCTRLPSGRRTQMRCLICVLVLRSLTSSGATVSVSSTLATRGHPLAKAGYSSAMP